MLAWIHVIVTEKLYDIDYIEKYAYGFDKLKKHVADKTPEWAYPLTGIKPGLTYGETDELGFHGVRDRLHVHDLQATILHQLGLDHERLIYHFQGRDFRLTDVHGKVVRALLA